MPDLTEDEIRRLAELHERWNNALNTGDEAAEALIEGEWNCAMALHFDKVCHLALEALRLRAARAVVRRAERAACEDA